MNVKPKKIKTILNSYVAQERLISKYDDIKNPGDASNLWLITKAIQKIAVRIFQKLFYTDQWYLLYSYGGSIPTSSQQYKALLPPRGRFWADPQVIYSNEAHYIFFEEYIFKEKKAHISVIKIDEHGKFYEPERVLVENFHLSYPFVFIADNKYYMVPESSAMKTIRLYECIEFPYQWRFKQNLIENVAAVDTTLFNYNDKWWLFTGIPEKDNSLPFVKLHLYYSNNLFADEWKPHPQNPIISDETIARPAGCLFVDNGRIIRPSQNCNKSYGYGIYLNEIDQLSEFDYHERTVYSMMPDWDPQVKATHTFSRDSQLIVIDAFKQRRKRISG